MPDAVVGRHYRRDSFGRLLYVSDGEQNDVRRGFDYDVAGRLTGYSHWNMVDGELVCEDPMLPDTCTRERLWQMQDTTTYAYDAADNRAGAGITLEPNSNRYDYFGGFAHDYDADGNLTYRSNGSSTQSFSWNSLGQLTGVTTNGVTVTYAYDGWGRRVQRTHGGSITRYVYDGDDLLQETDGSGGLLREYLYYPGVDEPHSVRVWAGELGGKLYRYAMESPGHVIGVTDSTGTVVNQYRYDPWGAAEGVVEGVSQPLRYMAREYDGTTGLYYVRNRWYMAAQGRFISEDPIGLAGGLNIYVYVGNDPANGLDPSGLCREGDFRITSGTYQRGMRRGFVAFRTHGITYYRQDAGNNTWEICQAAYQAANPSSCWMQNCILRRPTDSEREWVRGVLERVRPVHPFCVQIQVAGLRMVDRQLLMWDNYTRGPFGGQMYGNAPEDGRFGGVVMYLYSKNFGAFSEHVVLHEAVHGVVRVRFQSGAVNYYADGAQTPLGSIDQAAARCHGS